MKTEVLKHEPPLLFEFAMKNLPPSLQAIKRTDGYGGTFGIRLAEKGLKNHLVSVVTQTFIAEIYKHSIILYYPNYFSDMEDLAVKYEHEHGKEVTLKYYDEAV